MSDLTFKVESQLTATGFGSEQSSGHILQRGCPNRCVLVSVSDRRPLLTKLEPFFSFLTRFHLESDRSRSVLSISLFHVYHIYRFKHLSNASVHNNLVLAQQSKKELKPERQCVKCFLHLLALISKLDFLFLFLWLFFLVSSPHMAQLMPLPTSKTATFKLTNGRRQLFLWVIQLL